MEELKIRVAVLEQLLFDVWKQAAAIRREIEENEEGK
jgi:hypothetical protein